MRGRAHFEAITAANNREGALQLEARGRTNRELRVTLDAQSRVRARQQIDRDAANVGNVLACRIHLQRERAAEAEPSSAAARVHTECEPELRGDSLVVDQKRADEVESQDNLIEYSCFKLAAGGDAQTVIADRQIEQPGQIKPRSATGLEAERTLHVNAHINSRHQISRPIAVDVDRTVSGVHFEREPGIEREAVAVQDAVALDAEVELACDGVDRRGTRADIFNLQPAKGLQAKQGDRRR